MEIENNNSQNVENNENEFDARAFASNDEISANSDNSDDSNDSEVSQTNESSDDSSSNDDEDDSFSWAEYDDDDESDNNNDESSDDSTQEANNDNSSQDDSSETNSDNQDNDNDEKVNEFTDEQFLSFANEVGLDVESKEDFVNKLKALEEENEKLRQNQGSGVTNEKITNLSGLKDKTDEDLVRLDLEKQGFTEEEVNEAIDTFIDSGLLGIEAKKIRKTIDRAIDNERKKEIQSNVDEEAMLEQQRQQSIKELGEHINKSETMFGFKMAKNEEELHKVREGHLKYITSGKFLNDITSNNESLSEAAWLWKNKDVILNAMRNSGVSRGKSEILNEITNAEVNTSKRVGGGLDEDGNFNPNAFNS